MPTDRARLEQKDDAEASLRPGSHDDRRLDLRIASWLVASFFLFYLLFGRGYFEGSDEVGVFESTHALYEHGDLAIPPGAKHVFPGRDGRYYSHFAIGQSVLALPLYGLGKLAERSLPPPWVRALAGPRLQKGTVVYGGTARIFMAGLYAPFVSALLVALFFLFERRLDVSRRSALVSSVALGAATYVAVMSIYFLQHATEALTILGGAYFFHEYEKKGRLGALAAGSLLASLTILVRIPACVAGPALGGYLLWVLWERSRTGTQNLRRALLAIAAPFAAVLAVHIAVNQLKWGRWIWSPFLDQSSAFVTPLHEGLLGFLVSPGCSVFAYSPLLLLLPWTLGTFWRRHRALCVTVGAISLTFLLVCSKFEIWSGLYSSPGPRYLFAITPLLMLPVGPWLDRARGRLARGSFWALGAAGVVVQLLLLTASWGDVIVTMDYIHFEPALGFVWHLEQSPILGSALVLSQGNLAPWLWRLGAGWLDREAAPLPALLLLGLWAACFAACLTGLVREARMRAGTGGELLPQAVGP